MSEPENPQTQMSSTTEEKVATKETTPSEILTNLDSKKDSDLNQSDGTTNPDPVFKESEKDKNESIVELSESTTQNCTPEGGADPPILENTNDINTGRSTICFNWLNFIIKYFKLSRIMFFLTLNCIFLR